MAIDKRDLTGGASSVGRDISKTSIRKGDSRCCMTPESHRLQPWEYVKGEDNTNRKYLFPNGRQTIDFIFEAGLGHGFCIGRAVQCRYKAGLETDTAKQEKLMKDCNWYIDQVSRRENIVREEVVSIVKSIVARMEKDRIATVQTSQPTKEDASKQERQTI